MAINFPTSPSLNQEYSYGDKTWVYDGSGWKLKSIPVSRYTFSEIAPLNPESGDRWIEANSGIEYTYLDDGSSKQWVELGLTIDNSLPVSGTSNQVLAKNTNTSFDVSWKTLDKNFIGLGNVENTALSTWSGSNYMVHLGPVTIGEWNADPIGTTYGGTGLTSPGDSGNFLISDGTNWVSQAQPTVAANKGGTGLTSPGTAGNVLTSNGTTWVSQASNAATTGKAIAMAIVFGG